MPTMPFPSIEAERTEIILRGLQGAYCNKTWVYLILIERFPDLRTPTLEQLEHLLKEYMHVLPGEKSLKNSLKRWDFVLHGIVPQEYDQEEDDQLSDDDEPPTFSSKPASQTTKANTEDHAASTT